QTGQTMHTSRLDPWTEIRSASTQAARRLLAALALVSLTQFATAQVVLPSDAKPTCTVSPTEFASWFASGTVTLNGTVQPADGLTFPDLPNCNFFKFSEQMFLWLPSPAPANYRSDARVLNSSVFFDVSPADSSGQRTLIPVTPGDRNFAVKVSQLGPR